MSSIALVLQYYPRSVAPGSPGFIFLGRYACRTTKPLVWSVSDRARYPLSIQEGQCGFRPVTLTAVREKNDDSKTDYRYPKTDYRYPSGQDR